MPDLDALDRRLSAVERTLADGEHDLDALRAAGDRQQRITELEGDLADSNDRIAELEAATQALRGYVGNVRAVNDDVAERADAALAAVEDLEDRIEQADAGGRGSGGREHRTDGPSANCERNPRSPRRSGADATQDWPVDGDGFDSACSGERTAVAVDGGRFEAGDDPVSGDRMGSDTDADDAASGGLLARIRDYV
ncbi:DUF7310 family coiled-coil domain-containing protein [Halomicrobium urmianum]|uniref:DUF7310 family coiled-coil domain-containing protein n=1 Tax=Halomicrobium urmianum TaxID=1586233 RepID=UPI001CD9DFCD|nr:hypothetical protein [Halomicrobium urmianum]